jgi:hypothetical protein
MTVVVLGSHNYSGVSSLSERRDKKTTTVSESLGEDKPERASDVGLC